MEKPKKGNGHATDPLTESLRKAPVFNVSSGGDLAPGFQWTREEQLEMVPEEELEAVAALPELESNEVLDLFARGGWTDYQLWLMALRWLDLGDVDRAHGAMREIAASGQEHEALDYPYILNELIHGHYRPTGQYAEALILQRRLIEQYGDETLVQEMRIDEAVLTLESGDLEGGRALFEKLLGENPDDPDLVLELAQALVEGGFLAEAADTISDAEASERMDWGDRQSDLDELGDTITEAIAFGQDPAGTKTSLNGAYYGIMAPLRQIERKGKPDAADLVRLYELYQTAQERFPNAVELRTAYDRISHLDEAFELNAIEMFVKARKKG